MKTPIICPTVTAYDLHEYRLQLQRITTFAKRVHIDLMDGIFAPTKSPDINKIWLAQDVPCDIHLMFQHPDKQIDSILELKPRMVILQAEATPHSLQRAMRSLKGRTLRGISLLSATNVNDLEVTKLIKVADHVLIFSGHLGFHGGKADLSLLDKVEQIRQINPSIEIGWDGGINDFNASKLMHGGVDVLNVGGYIQKAADPTYAYHKLVDSLE